MTDLQAAEKDCLAALLAYKQVVAEQEEQTLNQVKETF